MYDYVNLRATLPDAEAEQRLARAPAFASSDGATDARGWVRVQHRGLRIDYLPEAKKVRIRGSLHTFAQGHNLGRFTAAEVARACADVAAVVDLPPERLTVVSLEAGVNIPSANPPRSFLENLSSHKGAPFAATKPPNGATRPLEYGAYHTDYWVKLYDKGKYSQLQGRPLPSNGPPHLLRYEVVYKRTRPLLRAMGLERLTLADLPQPGVMAAVQADISTHWKLTHHTMQDPDYTGLNFSDATLLVVAGNVAFWAAMKKSQPPSTYKRHRRRAQELLAQRAEASPYDEALAQELARLDIAQAA